MRMIYRRIESILSERIDNGRKLYTAKLVCGHVEVDHVPIRSNTVPTSIACSACVKEEQRHQRLHDNAEKMFKALQDITGRGYLDPVIIAMLDHIQNGDEQ